MIEAEDYLSCTEEDEFKNCNRTYVCCCPDLKIQGVCPFMFQIILTEDIE